MKSGNAKVLTIWLISLCVMLVSDSLNDWLDRFDRVFFPLAPIEIGSRLVFIFLTCYLIAVAIRYILRKLFWTVGRRLTLSYFLIGVMPFVLVTVLIVIVGYLVAGVLSQTTLKIERLNGLSRMAQWNLEYELTGEIPGGAPKNVEVYDSRDGSIRTLPKWLRTRSFSGLVRRKDDAVFVSAKLYQLDEGKRSVVLVQPVNGTWASALKAKNGMSIMAAVAEAKHDSKGGDVDFEFEGLHFETETDLGPFINGALRRGEIFWLDVSSPLYTWETGEPNNRVRMITALSNPWVNLLDFYFGNSQYVNVTFQVIAGIAGSLLVVYLMAAMLAGWLIFSITRAVNRIEKGTKAVEKGDFSYRIRMKPTNQLGEVAQSFNRMTESISSLLGKVAEQERLQSEINIAASIQRNLLPREGPKHEAVSFSAHFEPTASIGGDYYDVFNIDEHRLAVAIGDVSGHGLSTGLVMAMVKAAMTTLVEEGADEASLFVRLNDLVMRSTEKRAFMTLGFTIFDLEAHTIRHTNAGHLYPYVLRVGESPYAIEVPSLPLGVKPLAHPHTAECSLRDGDTVVYFSDGIIEATDGNGEPFGFDRVEKVLASVTGKTAAEIQTAVLDAVAVYTDKRAQEDDRTVMVVKFDMVWTEKEEPLEIESVIQ